MKGMKGLQPESKDEAKGFAISVAVHVAIFLLLASLGFFQQLLPKPEEEMPAEVEIYDIPGAGEAGGGSPAPAAEAAASAPAPDAVTIPEKDMTPEEKKEEKPQEEKPPTDNPTPNTNANPTNTTSTTNGTGQAQDGKLGGRGGEGHGEGVGRGNGTGPGLGGSGGGQGTGNSPPPPPPKREPPPPPPKKEPPPPPKPKARVEASLRSEATPEYPEDLIDQDVEGSVTVKILVAADGSVEGVNVISSSGHSEMDQAAVAAAWRFKFNPGDGGQRGVWTKTFRFRLN